MGSNFYENRGKFSDSQLVECYLKHKSQIAAAQELGCSRETVARAVRRSGIQMTGRKYNIGGHCQWKVTDDELKEDAKTLNAVEIAKKYGMSVEQVFRRAKNLCVDLIPVEYGHWAARAKRYGTKEFDKSITIEALIERDGGVCQICGKPIDRNDVINGHIRRNYPTVDHIIPLSKGGTHTWNNIQLAHMKCNAGKCDRITV